MFNKASIAALVVFSLLTTVGNAAFDKGGVSGMGARPLGMGGAFASIADSGDAIFYNPAGLIQVLRPEVSGMGAVILNGKEDLFDLAYVQPFGDQMAWALSTQQLLFTDGSENERIYLGTFAAPLAIDKSISFGLNVKLYGVDSSSQPGQQASGLGLDMGFLYHLPILDPRYGKQINIGLCAQDLDTTIRYQAGNQDPVALSVKGGVSYEFTEDLVTSCEFESINDPNLGNHTLLHTGIEGWFFEDHLGLRTGYSDFMTLPGQFTAGISYRSNTWGIDYAYIGHPQYLGSSHRISASWRFGDSFLGKVKSFIPEGVNAYVQGDIITLKWNNSPSISLAGYNVYFSKTSGGGYVKINQQPIKANYYSLRGLEKNTHYYFVVSSMTNTIPPVESQYSREVLAGTTSAPGAPVVVQSEIQNEGVIDIGKQAGLAGWPDPAKNGYKGYNIYYSEVSGGRFDKVNPQPIANVPTYLVRKLKVGQRYFFTFTTVGNDGTESAHSKEISFVALPYSAVLSPGTTH
ncbi:MAG TPA: hypothetical protein VJ873_10485 [bacterium]|nr:hypothetical protein [bacterium]